MLFGPFRAVLAILPITRGVAPGYIISPLQGNKNNSVRIYAAVSEEYPGLYFFPACSRQAFRAMIKYLGKHRLIDQTLQNNSLKENQRSARGIVPGIE
ncbi:MAG: hypothetical protein ACOCUK_01580 [bacterium]